MGEDLNIKRDVVMVGLGTTAPCYYRVMLPAMQLGCDWVGVVGAPPKLRWVTGGVRGESKMPDFVDDYSIVVLQQPAGKLWMDFVETMQGLGKKVVVEVDDYLHGIKGREDHQFQHAFDDKMILGWEEILRKADGVICSTEYILKKYRKFNENIYLCPNGIDLRRYALTRRENDTVNIGWAGATGHTNTIMPWINQLLGVMQVKPETTFISIGQPFADAIRPHVGDQRAISVPWAAIEQYPSAMSMMDIALAPAGGGGWYLGKSDLRWLEAGALGIPIIARSRIYREIEEGVTGFLAESPQVMVEKLMALIGDKNLRTTVGRQAQEHIRKHRSIEKMSENWEDALRKIDRQ